MEAGGGQAASASLGSSQPFGDGSSAGSTNMGTSPGLQPAAPMAVQVAVQPAVLQLQPEQRQQIRQQIQQQLQPEVKMDTMDALQPTLAQLNSPGSNENSLMSMKVEHDFDVDFNDYFTNSGSRDVSFGLGFNNKPVSAAAAPQRGQQPVAPATAAAIRLQIARNNVQQQQQQQQQVGRSRRHKFPDAHQSRDLDAHIIAAIRTLLLHVTCLVDDVQSRTVEEDEENERINIFCEHV